MLLNRYQLSLNMIRNRHTLSSIKVSKRPPQPTNSLRPSKHHKRPVTHIISSLERNVKDLKVFYHNLQEQRGQLRPANKVKINRVLRRNSSQSHLRAGEHSKGREASQGDQGDRLETDVFKVRGHFQRATGRMTNSIVELYEFYKKSLEKREKSTRILASIDLSNPNTALSLDVGKESILRQELAHQRDYQPIIQEEESRDRLPDRHTLPSKLESTSNIHKNAKERTSNLASQLLRKGLYDMSNVANLMLNKKYKLTREKEESFQMTREKQLPIKAPVLKENIDFSNTKQPDTAKQILKLSQRKGKTINVEKEEEYEVVPSGKHVLSPSQSLEGNRKEQSKPRAEQFELSTTKKSKRSRAEEASILEESPIVSNNGFAKSKYYVQPIPLPNAKKEQPQRSISLEWNSRLIDTDLLPFHL